MTAMNREVPDWVPRDISCGLAPAVFERFSAKTGTDDFLSWFKVDTRHIDQGPTRLASGFQPVLRPAASLGTSGAWPMESSPDSRHFTHIVSLP